METQEREIYEEIADAAMNWWGSKRPGGWDTRQHLQKVQINCMTYAERILATACGLLADFETKETP